MATVNESLRDAAIGHAVNLQQYTNGVVRRMIALLSKVDADISAQLRIALQTLPRESFTVQRLEVMLDSARALNAQAHEALGVAMTAEMRSIVEYEAEYQARLFGSTLPGVARVGIAPLQINQVYAAAMARPFQGRLMAEWALTLASAKMNRLTDAVRMGYVEGQTIDQIVRRVRGTRAAQYSDGILAMDRRSAEAVVRTAIGHMASVTREAFYEANRELVGSVQWVSTIDTRTSEVCMVRDGREYSLPDHKPIGHSYEWGGGPGELHWNCRSASIPVIKGWRELGVDMPAGERASMDGQIPAKTTYGQWLKRQSAARQDEVLGPTRGALMRRGGLSLDKFADKRGRWLTLDELREREARAFTLAGV